MRRAPTVVVAFCAAVVELVILAAAGNQWIVDHLINNQSASELPRDHELKASLTSFPWRFAPEGHLRMLWLGEIVSVVGMIIVVFLLVYAFVAPMRAPRSFVSVFFGTWGIVVGLSQIAAIGRSLLAFGDRFDNGHDPEGLGRFWFSVFRGPTAETVLFGGVSGLIVAVVAGIVAAATSRNVADLEDEGAAASELDRTALWAETGSTALAGSQAADTVAEPSWSTPSGADDSAPAERPPWPPAETGTPSWSQPVQTRPGTQPSRGGERTTQMPYGTEPATGMPYGGEPTEVTGPRGGERTTDMPRPSGERRGAGLPPAEERPPGSPEPPALP